MEYIYYIKYEYSYYFNDNIKKTPNSTYTDVKIYLWAEHCSVFSTLNC